jgi:putative transposase
MMSKLKWGIANATIKISSNLKSEQIKKRIYSTRAEAKSDIFDYIEGFYNRVRRHKHLDQLSPHEFERQRQTAL